MTPPTYIQLLANEIAAFQQQNNHFPVVVLPNNRAKLFLLHELKKWYQKPIFAPDLLSIEEFISEMAQLKTADELTLLFEFYAVYTAIVEKSQQKSFDYFANWAPTALADFNEIDRYLLNPNEIFDYLKAIDDIKKWGADPNDTALLKRYVNFWSLLPKYYQALKTNLLSKNSAYQGLAYREANDKRVSFAKSTQNHYFFCGFNALNAAEENIIKELISEAKATVFFDIDKTIFRDQQHDAGLFLRRYVATWPFYRTHNPTFFTDDFQKSKEINCIGTSGKTGQVYIAAEKLQQIFNENPDDIAKTAVVLADETLLQPLLQALPESIDAFNITMGLPLEKSAVAQFFKDVLKMHLQAVQRKGNSIYHRDLLRVFSHNFLAETDAAAIAKYLKDNNIAFCKIDRLKERAKHPISTAILSPMNANGSNFIAILKEIINALKQQEVPQKFEARLQRTFLFEYAKVVDQLEQFLENKANQIELSLENLIQFLKQLIKNVTVSFEGEPLDGLQIMGILESRTLDFKHVIVLGMNEGKLPAGKSFNSFIPHDVKREKGLPTFREKDAIFSYHFYHLIQRVETANLIYNVDVDGLDGAEKSRFITQLLFDSQPNHKITETLYNTFLDTNNQLPHEIEKTDHVLAQIKKLLQYGLSPSAMASYLRSPLAFYKQYILKIQPDDEVEENMAVNTLGTIIHDVLEELYQPRLNQILTPDFYSESLAKFPELLVKKAATIFREGDLSSGQNYLEMSFAKSAIKTFLEAERDQVLQGNEIVVKMLEEKLSTTMQLPKIDFPIKVAGKVDRIDQYNGVVRVLDYKTGSVKSETLKLKIDSDFEANLKEDKVIQLMTYAFASFQETPYKSFEAGIISLRDPRKGAYKLQTQHKDSDNQLITSTEFDFYKELVEYLILEMLNPKIPFQENRVDATLVD